MRPTKKSLGLFLEIAINKGAPGSAHGGASGLLGIKLEDPIRIEFAK